MRFLLTDKFYLKIFIPLAIGIFCADNLSILFSLCIPVFVGIMLQLATAVFKINRPKLVENVFYSLLIYAGILFHYFNFILPLSISESKIRSISEQNHPFLVRIDQKPEIREKSIRVRCQLLTIEKEDDSFHSINQKMNIYLSKNVDISPWNYGDLISLHSKVKLIEAPHHAFEFNYKQWLNRSKIYTTAYAQDALKVGHDSSALLSFFYFPMRLRDYFEHEIERYITAPSSLKVAKSILLGIRSDFDQELLDAYSSTGTIHILSVSGLHFGILITFLGYILGLIFPKHSKISFIIKQLISFLYALITGFSPPVFRSFLMFLFLDIQKVYNVRTSSFNLLFLSAIIIILYETNQLFDIGFVLSYAALLGIMVLYNKMLWKIEFEHRLSAILWETTCVMFAAWLFTAPFTIYYFHKLSFMGMLSNYVVLPITVATMYLGFGLIALSKIAFVAQIIGEVLAFLIYIQNQIICFFERIPLASFSNLYIDTIEMIILLMLLGILLIFIYAKDRFSLRVLVVLFLGISIYHFINQYNITKTSFWIDFKTSPFTTLGYKSENHLWLLSDSIPPSTNSFTIKPFILSQHIDSVTLNSIKSEVSIPPAIGVNIENQPTRLILCRENKSEWYRYLSQRDTVILGNNLGDYYSKKLKDTIMKLNKVFE